MIERRRSRGREGVKEGGRQAAMLRGCGRPSPESGRLSDLRCCSDIPGGSFSPPANMTQEAEVCVCVWRWRGVQSVQDHL